uniref:RanBP-type and C3HC4-type zinc finger-containing protein 1 n=1 Tax=Strix occidentalis caurina TaxID=311401 RepID=A0A8D0FC01_STROC
EGPKTKPGDLALHLAQAIEYGDEEVASQCAVALARQQATLSILLKESNYPTEDISMKVGVEDATSSASITLRVRAHTTIATLKQQVFQDYGFHPLVQRWIIGQCLCVDERTVSSYGIRKDGDTAFLYLLSAKMAELTEQRYEEDQAQVMLSSTSSLSDDDPSSPGFSLPGIHPPCPGLTWAKQPLPWRQVAPPAGWSCPKCTFINKPTRPGCEMCSTDRPEDYVVPGTYKPDETELWRMQQEQEGILQYQKREGERMAQLRTASWARPPWMTSSTCPPSSASRPVPGPPGHPVLPRHPPPPVPTRASLVPPRAPSGCRQGPPPPLLRP